jgi:ABC-type molybdate transport system substrate-binding protein
MEYPHALNPSNRSGPVSRLAVNSLCALVRPDFDVASASLVEPMLDPAINRGTSTPNSDPAGDHALAVFRKLHAVKPGAGAPLWRRAHHTLTRPRIAVP